MDGKHQKDKFCSDLIMLYERTANAGTNAAS
jgi:hypothetical protein